MLIAIHAFLPAFLLISVLPACQTAPTRYEQIEKGQWQAKMLIRNLKESKSQILNVDIIAVRPNKLRMEAITTLGTHLGSFVMIDGQMKYILPSERRVVQGPATARGMRAIIGVELSPELLMKLLFDQAPSGADWTCKKDPNGYLESCENNRESLKLAWLERDAARKKVEISSRDFELQIALQGFSTKVEEGPSTFALSTPDGYKVQNIQ